MGLSNEAVQMTLLGDAAEHGELGVMVWNEELRYVALNPHAAELVGSTREALLAARVGDTNRTPEAQAAIDDALRNAPSRGSMTMQRPDGTAVDLEWVVFPTTIAGLPHVIGLMWDRSSFQP